VRDTAYKSLQARDELSAELDRDPTPDEIAARIGVTREQVVSAMEAIVEPISLYEPVFSDNGDSLYVIDQLSDTSRDSTDESWLENIALREAVRTLTPREQKIIALRYYKDKTQMEIAAEIGISQAQVSRVEKAALEKLRKQL
jgi:RNA polymerase sporulation-specific sigma factor